MIIIQYLPSDQSGPAETLYMLQTTCQGIFQVRVQLFAPFLPYQRSSEVVTLFVSCCPNPAIFFCTSSSQILKYKGIYQEIPSDDQDQLQGMQ